MSLDQRFLSWEDHKASLILAFGNLFKNNSLVDCTLAADGQYLKAHKLVLSACSPYFELLFKQEGEKNPIIVLKDMKFEELEAVVHYMYKGEVEISEDKLGAFMEVVNSLQIRGISNNGIPHVKEKCEESSEASMHTTESCQNDALNFQAEDLNGSADQFVVDRDISDSFSLHLTPESSISLSPCSVSGISSVTSSPAPEQNESEENDVDVSSYTVPNWLTTDIPSNVNADIKIDSLTEMILDEKCDIEIVENVIKMDDEEEGSAHNVDVTCDGCSSDQTDHGEDRVNEISMATLTAPFACEDTGPKLPMDESGSVAATADLIPSDCGSPPPIANTSSPPPPATEQPFVTHTADHPFQCEQCGKAFTFKSGLQKHRQLHNDKRFYRCELCGKTYVQKIRLRLHLLQHTVNGRLAAKGAVPLLPSAPCAPHSLLSVAFITEPAMTDGQRSDGPHEQTDASLKQVDLDGPAPLANSCPPPLPSPLSPRPNAASAPGSRLSSGNTTEPRMTDCEVRDLFGRHGAGAEAVPETVDRCATPPAASSPPPPPSDGTKPPHQHRCQECGRVFRSKIVLARHRRMQCGDRCLACEICGKTFTRKSRLLIHLRTHTNERPFACEMCGKAFTQKSSLHTHLRTHTGERPFTCKICSKAFAQKGSLQSHMRIHTGERPFACEVCDKAFAKNYHLHNHMRIHTGERPFICNKCGKAFTRKDSLQKHLRIYTG